MTVVWTDDLLEFIRRRAGEKASASTIANDLRAQGYAVTRNAVIGKCHRNKISLQSVPQGRPERNAIRGGVSGNPSSRPRMMDNGPLESKLPALHCVETSSSNPVSMSDLNKQNCHWPMGDFAARPPYLYCGDPAAFEGCPYCARHFLVSTRATKGTKNVATKQVNVAA